jgi:hypothetical protein
MGSMTRRSISSSNRHQRISSDWFGNAGDDGDRLRGCLRYATYSSYYDQYCGGDVDDCEGRVDDDKNSSAATIIGGGSRSQTACETATTNALNRQKRSARMRRVSDSSRLLFNDKCSSGKRRHRQLKPLSSPRRRIRNQSNDSSSSTTSSSMSRLEYERRKAVWAAKYTSVSTLRKSFGTNKNRIWGDFDASNTRKLYHTLLPRALLELRVLKDGLMSCDEEGEESSGSNNNDNKRKSRHWHQRLWQRKESLVARNDSINGDDAIYMDDIDSITYLQQELKELAPLAFRARLAAKQYARERSMLPARIGSMLYDGYRSWKKYGKWKSTGMTWEQVWNKYEDQVLKEAMIEMPESSVDHSTTATVERLDATEDLDDEELTARICLRILERSVVTNDAIDRLFLKRLAVEDNIKQQGDGVSWGLMASGPQEDVIFEESRKRRHRKRRRKLLIQERQRRRKLRIQADLQAIEKMFDDDIRELLRYSYLSTEEGEKRRSKRKRGAFFWKSTSWTSSNIIADSSDNDNSTSATTSNTSNMEEMKSTAINNPNEKDCHHVDSENIAVEGMAAVARGGGGATDDGTECSELLAASMFSMIRVSSESNVNGNSEGISETNDIVTNGDIDDGEISSRKISVHEVFTLRMLATTKERMTLLQESTDLGKLSWKEGENWIQ